jgi:hypothetical protein
LVSHRSRRCCARSPHRVFSCGSAKAVSTRHGATSSRFPKTSRLRTTLPRLPEELDVLIVRKAAARDPSTYTGTPPPRACHTSHHPSHSEHEVGFSTLMTPSFVVALAHLSSSCLRRTQHLYRHCQVSSHWHSLLAR